jgi:hypothetical protein
MKRSLLFITLAAALTLSHAEAAPQVSIDEALKIANSYLKENGRTDVWITGIALEKPSAGRSGVWAVTWSAPVVLDDTKRETGIEIAMDGSVARYTEKVANASSPAVVGVPADRAPLSNHRTRSQRPSILDLKH